VAGGNPWKARGDIMTTLEQRLDHGDIIIIDGAIGTEL